MKKLLFVFLSLLALALVACGGEPSTAERLIGKWEGTIQNAEGDPFPATMEFLEDGKMIIVIGPGTLNVVQTASYSFNDDGSMRIVADDAEDGAEPGRRVVEFVGEDTVRFTAETAGRTDTFTRVKDE